MPDLDVSFLVTDPDFATQFQVTRISEVVGADGIARHSSSTSNTFTGVVTPASDAMQRLADGTRLNSSISVITQYPLADGANMIKWKGRDYTVRSVADYSQWGSGFVQAICDLFELNP